ncbi:MAG: prepilin-type N-terminal cleavage/methylation domain-containing protein [Puniceicoccales bacterium]|jgi:prepilin-type N-terminal cleavage/methylation domain-containing protein|nr:prepilin-type N-terminal cleavage/methylation domain-containing protein [Puniceicoccales bacterium]
MASGEVGLKSKNDGFTLMETMVTLFLVAMMSMLAVPYVKKYIKDNQIREFISDYRGLIGACRAYSLVHHQWPIPCEAGQLPADLLPFLPDRFRSSPDLESGNLPTPSITEGAGTYIYARPNGIPQITASQVPENVLTSSELAELALKLNDTGFYCEGNNLIYVFEEGEEGIVNPPSSEPPEIVDQSTSPLSR